MNGDYLVYVQALGGSDRLLGPADNITTFRCNTESVAKDICAAINTSEECLATAHYYHDPAPGFMAAVARGDQL